MATTTAVRPELELKKISERLDETLADALGQVDRVDQRLTTGHELSEADQSIRRSCQQIASDCRDALHRIMLGTYGLCLGCDDPIDEERLRQFPYAALCLTCKKQSLKLPAPAKQGKDGDPTSSGLGSRTPEVPALGVQATPEEGSSLGNDEGSARAEMPDHAVAASSSGSLPRATCPVCNRSVPVRRNGSFREHMTIGRGTKTCLGSGATTAALLKEAPTPAAESTDPPGPPEQQKPAKPAGGPGLTSHSGMSSSPA